MKMEGLTQEEQKKSDERRTFFDAHAHGWEERGYPTDVRVRLENLVDCFGIERGEKILDVGCGEGVLVPYLLDRLGPTGFIVELDNSLEMLKGAMRKSARQVQCVWAGVETLPLVDEDFDRVICFASFPHFANSRKALKQIHRVLKPAGRLIIAHLLSREEIARHHAKSTVVLGDELPEETAMRRLLKETGFCVRELENRPGRYLLAAVKE
ncbi:MAG TPA: hypothetical protein DD376_04020 [Sutterella sp.]|nr:hypothetical protein [Sutterella sp.]